MVVRSEGGVIALAITPRTTLETYRSVVRLQIEARDLGSHRSSQRTTIHRHPEAAACYLIN